MGRSDKPPIHEHPPSIPIQIEGVGLLQEGTIFSVKGSHGRFRYVTSSNNGTVIEAFGGISGHNQFRAFRPEQVTKIHKGKV